MLHKAGPYPLLTMDYPKGARVTESSAIKFALHMYRYQISLETGQVLKL